MISGIWWPTFFPALAIATCVVAVNLIADALQSVTERMSALPNIELDPTPPAPSTTAALQVEDLHARLCRARHPATGAARRVVRGQAWARPTGSSASPAAASRRPPTRPSATCPRNGRITSGRIMVAGDDITKNVRRRAPPVPDAPRLDGLPGPGRGAEPVDQGRAAGHRGVHGPRPERGTGPWQRARRTQARPDRRPGTGDGALSRTSSRAACSNASSSRWPSHPNRNSSCSTSRRPASTRPSRRASSISSVPLIAETSCGGPAHRPQPRGHPHDVRPGRRHVRRQDRRGGGRCRGLRAATAPVHGRSAAGAAAPRRAQVASGRWRRSPARCRRSATPLPTCVFVDRCPLATDLCREVEPPIVDVGTDSGRAAITATGSGTSPSRRRASPRSARAHTMPGATARRCLEDVPPGRP